MTNYRTILGIIICCCWQLLPVQQNAAQTHANQLGRYSAFIADTINDVGEAGFFITQWNASVPATIKVVRRLDDRTAIVRADDALATAMRSAGALVLKANNFWKLSANLDQVEHKVNSLGWTLVVSGTHPDSVAMAIFRLGKKVTVLQVNEPSQSMIVQCQSSDALQLILASAQITYIDKWVKAKPEIGIIGYDRSFHGISAVDNSLPDADGRNVVVSVKEQMIQAEDLDLHKRVLPSPLAASSITNHATVVASIIGGAGNLFYDGRGIAHGCKFFPSSFANLFADESAVLNAAGVTVQNHSYGTILQPFYGPEALSYDHQVWQNQSLLHVFSAGNQGLQTPSTGRYAGIAGFANITGNFKSAKNIITVGAITNKEAIPDESSAGPLYDGRLAPQLIALGPSGTSDAAAIVSGTAAVMQQKFAENNSGKMPDAALLRSLLFNSADDVGNPGPDFKTGYGLLNSLAAINAISRQQYFSDTARRGTNWSHNITVPSNTARLKTTLVWADSSAQINAGKALLNDLDVELVDLTRNLIYQPWVLNSTPHPDSIKSVARRGRDSLNTAEQITISYPATGNYQLRVKTAGLLHDRLPFFIAIQMDTADNFQFTHPMHASDINLLDKPVLAIKWSGLPANPDATGILSIRYNGSNNWEILSSNVLLSAGKYDWPIKDSSAVIQFRMETASGSFLSKEVVAGNLTRVNFLFNCNDSVGLAWNAHPLANAYAIYTLTDSPYLKLLRTVTDTVFVASKADLLSPVFAVEPLLTNQLAATRSLAVNADFSAVQCYYTALNYNVLDQNVVRLSLDLTTTLGVASVVFERTDKAGAVYKTEGTQKVIAGITRYEQTVDSLSTGTAYFRARINLTGQQTIYTDILPVLTSGPKALLLFPNPVVQGALIRVSLRQGIPFDSKLVLSDASGRMIRNYAFIPTTIETKDLPAGLVMYQLISEKGETMETGKIMVL